MVGAVSKDWVSRVHPHYYGSAAAGEYWSSFYLLSYHVWILRLYLFSSSFSIVSAYAIVHLINPDLLILISVTILVAIAISARLD